MFARNEELRLYLHECRGMRLGDASNSVEACARVGEGARHAHTHRKLGIVKTRISETAIVAEPLSLACAHKRINNEGVLYD